MCACKASLAAREPHHDLHGSRAADSQDDTCRGRRTMWWTYQLASTCTSWQSGPRSPTGQRGETTRMWSLARATSPTSGDSSRPSLGGTMAELAYSAHAWCPWRCVGCLVAEGSTHRALIN